MDGESVGRIGPGLLTLVGATASDEPADARALAEKLANLRIFADADQRMNLSVLDTGGGVLVVSQFTLYGDVRRGRRPSFTAAADPSLAEPLITEVVAHLDSLGVPTATGRFGAMMAVDLVNDGPVTLVIDVVGGSVV